MFAQIVSKFLAPERTKIFITYSVKLECSKESSEGLLPLEMALLSKSTLEVFFFFFYAHNRPGSYVSVAIRESRLCARVLLHDAAGCGLLCACVRGVCISA